MKRLKAILLTLIPCINLYGQINISDSTVQVSGFWSKGDKKTYSITQKKINIKGADTLSNEQTKFYVDIIIIDSASESYTIDWCYYNHDNASSEKGEVRIITNDKTYVMQMSQTVDSEQLADVTYKYLKLLSESTGEEAPNREEFKNFSNTTRVISWIHETGWLLYSIEKKVVKTVDRTIIEERRIEIEQQ